MKGLFKLKNNEKGQSMVEFAIVLPILMLLVVGIIQFGLIFNVKITLANEARDAVRLIAVGSISDIEADDFVRKSLKEYALLSKYVDGTKLEVIPGREIFANGEVMAKVTIIIHDFDLIIKKEAVEKLSGSATMMVEPNFISSENGDQTKVPLERFSFLYKLLDVNTPDNPADPAFPNFNIGVWGDEYGSFIKEANTLYNGFIGDFQNDNDLAKTLKEEYSIIYTKSKWIRINNFYEDYLKK